MSLIDAPVSKEISDAQKAIQTIDQRVAEIRKQAKSGAGGGGGKGKSADTLAKEEIDRQKKALEQMADNEIRAVNASKDNEVEKARKIVEINKKLKEQLELLDGKYYDVQAKRAEELIKQEEKDTEERKKLQIGVYDDTTNAEKKQIDNVKKL